LGNHLSIFCLLFCATSILSTMYTMRQQDTGQQQMPGMQWMMYLMPVMYIFIFNNYSSGLNYYYFISSLVTVLTMAIMRKMTDEKKLLAQLEANKAKRQQQGKAAGGRMSNSSLMAKLEALQKEQERLQQERMNREKK
jgi:YidC/Oxa1 family membrane protein insertase